MGRSIFAVFAGYLIFALPSVAFFRFTGQDPHAGATPTFMMGAFAWGIVCSVAAGWTAAKIAQRRETLHGALVAGVIAIFALASMYLSRQGAWWTQIAAMLVFAPFAILGGFVRSLVTGPSAFTE
jgi:hypothetical protein